MLPLLLSALERPEEKRIFTLFFQAHEQGLLRYARSLTGSPVLGEEVCQEAWMKCLQHAETFFAIPPDRRLGWMVVIVKHTAYSLLEKEGTCPWTRTGTPPPQRPGTSRGSWT